jgi:hypothetical protein
MSCKTKTSTFSEEHRGFAANKRKKDIVTRTLTEQLQSMLWWSDITDEREQ